MPNEGDPNNPNPGGSQGDDRKFTQAEVNDIVQKRLEQDRKRRSADGLADAERTGLLNEIETLKTSNTALKAEIAGVKTNLETEKKTADGIRRAYKAELVNRAIGASAMKANAVDPTIVGQLLEGRTRVREITEDGQPTGKFAVEVKVTKVVDGKEESAWLAPDDGVKDLLERSPFLVKSQTPPGAGTPPASKPPEQKPGTVPEGVVKSEMPGVGHLPKGGGAGSSVSDLFAKAGDSLEVRLRQA